HGPLKKHPQGPAILGIREGAGRRDADRGAHDPQFAVGRSAALADTERPFQPSRAIAWANSASYSRMLLTDLEAHSVARLHDSQCSAASARNTVPQEASRCTASGLVSGQRSRTVDQ